MLVLEKEKEVEIRECDWCIAEPLFIKWGYVPKGSSVEVVNIDDVTSELSAWGIPWKRTKWSY